MTEVVLDTSVVLKWFAAEQRSSEEARKLRGEYEAGHLSVAVPALDDLLLEVAEPELQSIASWVARGLTAYDAVYAALAEERGQPLVTDDQAIVAVAGELTRPLVGGLHEAQ